MEGVLVMKIKGKGIKYYVRKGIVHIDTGLTPEVFFDIMKEYVDEHGLEANR